MSRPSLRFMSNEYIEGVTSDRIRQYEAKINNTVKFPIPIEEIIDQVLDLSILWDEIKEQPGELILAGLKRQSRMIVVNEKHLALFEDKPGLLRSTQGHEAGHADLEGRLGDQGPALFESEQDRIVRRDCTKSNEQVEILLDLALRNEKAYRLWRKITDGQDTPEQKSAMDRYQSAILMPKWLLEEATKHRDLTRWPNLYDIANEAQVNISNLVTRLRRLNMIFIPKGSKTIYRNAEEYSGQKSLFD
jgi:hypothetical protein